MLRVDGSSSRSELDDGTNTRVGGLLGVSIHGRNSTYKKVSYTGGLNICGNVGIGVIGTYCLVTGIYRNSM